MRRKLAAILAADVSGYSRLVAVDEEGTLARLIADRRLFDDIVGRSEGRVFKTAGDAVLAEFASAVDALRAAMAIQSEIHLRNAAEAEARRMRYRIGVTIGDVVEQDGDLLGDGVNIASRLEGLAEPGGICLSRGVHEQVGSKLPVAFRDIGLQKLKNMPVAVHAFTIAAASLTGGAPSRPTASRRILPRVVWIAAVAAVVGLVVIASRPWDRRTTRPAGGPVASSRAEASPIGPQTFVFGPDPELPAEAKSASLPAFSVDAIPFVNDAGRAMVAAALAPGRSSAVAITRAGVYGVSAGQDSPDRAAADALGSCFNAGGTNCRLFEQDGTVVWPEALPAMPAKPWVDASVSPTPFDADRIAGLRPRAKRALGLGYPQAAEHKALALGPRGFYRFYTHQSTAEEAERLALESCGVAVGTPCRVVAVDDAFVVPLRAP